MVNWICWEGKFQDIWLRVVFSLKERHSNWWEYFDPDASFYRSSNLEALDFLTSETELFLSSASRSKSVNGKAFVSLFLGKKFSCFPCFFHKVKYVARPFFTRIIDWNWNHLVFVCHKRFNFIAPVWHKQPLSRHIKTQEGDHSSTFPLS